MVTLVTFHTFHTWTLNFVFVYALTYFSGFLNEWLLFYDLFCEGPCDLRIYASMAVRGLAMGVVTARK